MAPGDEDPYSGKDARAPRAVRRPQSMLLIRTDTRPLRAPVALLPRLGVWAAAGVCAAFVGAAFVRGGPWWMAAAALVAVLMLPLFGEFAFPALLGWIVLSGVLYPFVRVPPYVTFDRLWVLLLAAGLFFGARHVRWSATTTVPIVALAWLAAAFGLRATMAGPSGLQVWVDAILLPTILFLLAHRYVVTTASARRVAGALAAGGTLIAAIGLAGKFVGFELATRSGGAVRLSSETGGEVLERISGPYPVPEIFVVALVVTLGATLYWMQVQRPGLYAVGAAAATVHVLAIAFTLFRAGWIAALLVILLAFGLRPRRHGRLLATVVLAAVVGVVASSELRQNETFTNRVQNSDNIESRIATWKEALQIFGSAPLFGVGVNQYPYVAPAITDVTYRGVSAVPFPHSSYFGQLAEQGLFGFIPLLAVTLGIWWLLRHFARASRSREDDVLAACAIGAALGYLILSLTLTMLPYGPSNAFLMVLLGVVAGRLDALRAEAPAQAAAPVPRPLSPSPRLVRA